MKMVIDTDSKSLQISDGSEERGLDLYSKEAFEVISKAWLKIGWDQKYVYTFSWLGRPIIQLPEDMVRSQEAVYQVKPTVIVETGVAHGGSLVFNAGLLKLMGGRKVIGIDIEIRPNNRKEIESHFLAPFIHLIEGDAIAPATLEQVKTQLQPDDRVMVFLDSCHERNHVYKELKLYSELVSVGSYIVATDGSMQDLYDVPRGRQDWVTDNPVEAVRDFLNENPNFELRQPAWLFNESQLKASITHWPEAWLLRVR